MNTLWRFADYFGKTIPLIKKAVCASSSISFERIVREKLIQRTKQKSGEVKTVIGYFNSLDKVAKTVADDILARKCNNGEIKDISQYVAEYRKAVAEIVDAVNGNENKEETNND